MSRILASLLLIAWTGICPAQAAEDEALAADSVADIPSGVGVLRGTVAHRNPERSTAGLSVGLYSLSREGRPSLRQGLTDEEGRFRFEEIPNSPQVTYLVGVRIDGIPYGSRVRFEEGSTRAEVRIEIDDPIASLEPLTLQDSLVSFRWRGGVLEIREEHRLQNQSDRVVRVPRGTGRDRKAPFEVRLPDEASEITPGFGQVEEYFERRGNRLLFWGPIHPGESQLQFSYRVPGQPDGGEKASAKVDPKVVFRPRILPTPGTFTALIPESDPDPEVTGLTGSGTQTHDELSYRSFRAEGDSAGGDIEITVYAPAEVTNLELLEIVGASVWFELDDTALDVKVDYNLLVSGEARLVGTPEAPVLTLELPRQAELLGIAPMPQLVGATLGTNAQVEVTGPLPAGPSRLSLHYRMPADRNGASIDLSFPRDIPLLNVLVADTGIRIEDERLHRRRPMRQGTRLFLHREAFQVEAAEPLSISLHPVDHANFPRLGSRVAVLSAAALAIAFMLIPLRASKRKGSGTGGATEGVDPTRIEREALYASMRDLEHDFETGKLEAEDHAQLKRQLELRAAELMESEKIQKPVQPPAEEATCNSCATPLQKSWQFCARCGAPL